MAVAIMVAFFVSPLASAAPDRLEHVADTLGIAEQVSTPAVIPMADYQVSWFRGAWLATSAAGVIGAIVVFVLAWGLSRRETRRNLALEAQGLGAIHSSPNTCRPDRKSWRPAAG